MTEKFIFVSCGQYTEPEKALGKSIAEMVKSHTGIDAFFAEEVQDLNGLDSNILSALRDAVGFITVLHPRGTITRPDGSQHVRASVWIEQEIAIATYIHRTEKRPLPIIAFIHQSVGREGLRDLVHLNPIRFSSEAEVLEELPARLLSWAGLKVGGVEVLVKSDPFQIQQGYRTRHLQVELVNETNGRIDEYTGRIRIPTALLKHWNTSYLGEESSPDARLRSFRFTEEGRGMIPPHSKRVLWTTQYCIDCAVGQFTGELPIIAATVVDESAIEVQMWIAGREYKTSKTIKELSQQAS
jgi:hypothetical protein